MASDPTPDTPAPSADDLRKALLEQQLAEARQREAARDAERRRHADFAERFLEEDVTEAERALVRRVVMNAVKDGKMEAMVYSFPCKLCTDSGRAINNAAPNWPDTLQGKAKQLYDRYMEVGKPRGYRLKASIISFPGGMPGDVGLFLSWAPESY